MNRRILVLLLLVSLGLWFIYQQRPKPFPGFDPEEQRKNLLTLPAAGSATLIPVVPPEEFDGLTQREVLQRRRDRVAALRTLGNLSALIPESYEPLSALYGAIEDRAPWWGLEGLYFHGPGQRSIDGPAEETRFLLNPLLLVGLQENYAHTTRENPRDYRSYYPILEDLELDPAAPLVIARYNVRGFLDYLRRTKPAEQQDGQLYLSTYNARDFGYNYFAFDSGRSHHIAPQVNKGAPIPNLQFLHRGGSCGFPGGCNNMSPFQPELVLSLSTLPARLAIKLWRELAPSIEAPADVLQLFDLD